MAKNYSAVVNISGFYYAKLIEDSKEGVKYGEKVHVPFAQSVSISTEQSIEKSYGDGVVAEMAVSTGVTSLSMGWHTIPLEVRQDLLGLEVDEDGLTIQKGTVTPPDVAVILTQDKNDGTKELVGLTKGKFMLPETSGETKEDTVTFQNQEIEGEFSSRHYDNVTQVMVHIGEDDDGKEDKFMSKVFLDSEGL